MINVYDEDGFVTMDKAVKATIEKQCAYAKRAKELMDRLNKANKRIAELEDAGWELYFQAEMSTPNAGCVEKWRVVAEAQKRIEECCGNCKYWIGEMGGAGCCKHPLLFCTDIASTHKGGMWIDDPYAGNATGEDFGCNKWEIK